MPQTVARARRALPILVALVLGMVAVGAWSFAARAEADRNRRLLEDQAEAVGSAVAARIDLQAAGLERASLRWLGIERLDLTLARVESSILLRDPTVARTIWLGPDGRILWSIGAAGVEPAAEIQRWLDAQPDGIADAADPSAVEVGAVTPDPAGRPLLPISLRVRLESGIGGTLVVAYDAPALIRAVIPVGGTDFVVRAVDGHGRTVLAGAPTAVDAPRASAELSRDPLELVVEIAPTAATWSRMRSSTPGIVLIGGLAFAILTGLAMRLGQVQGMRTRQAEMLGALRREVDARTAAEAQLAQRAEALERSNADLSRFAHVISHDLRAPLNVMEMHLQLLAEQSDSDEPDRHVLAARRASQRMVGMIDGLLDYARVGAATGEDIVDARAAAAAAVGNLESAIRQAGAQVEIAELPSVTGHHEQLVHVFQNLIGNAVRHRGDAPTRIRVACEPRPAHWLFRVTDNGPGIPPASAERIFGLFEAGGATAGSGVGLAICRRVVEGHGGRIWVQSHPDEGTSVLFTWPRQPAQASSDSDSGVSPSASR